MKNDKEKIPGSVCLLAPHANANPTWPADLAWVKQTLSRMGIPVVATLTHKTPLSEIENVASAETSLLLSHDAGLKAADYLSATYNIEQVCKGIPLPIGMTNTQRWLADARRAVRYAENLGEHGCGRREDGDGNLPSKVADGPFLYRTPAAIVADATVGIPLVRFVTEDMEMTPEFIALYTSQRPVRELLDKELKDLGLSPKVVYGTDVYKTRMGLREVKPKIIFGSTIERHASEGLPVAYVVEVVRMMRQFRMINREYFGYTGILNLFESVQNEWTMGWRSKEKRYEAKW